MIIEKNQPVVRQLEKSKKELYPDLAESQSSRLREIQRQKKEQHKQDLMTKKEAELKARQEKEAKSYDRIMNEENMMRNTEVKASADASAAEEFEDDFF